MRLRRWAPALGYAALVFWLSEQPQAAVAPYVPFSYADKLAHAAEYGVFALLVRHGLGGRHAGSRGAWIAAAVATAFGAFDEWHQSWDPSKHRVAAVDDALADLLGAALAAFVITRLKPARSSS